jgi:hypothetical protein
MGEIGKGHEGPLPDTQQFLQHLSGRAVCNVWLRGSRIETGVGIEREVGVRVALYRRQPLRDTQAATLAGSSSSPRASQPRSSRKAAISVPSPQPTSSTFAPDATWPAITAKSGRKFAIIGSSAQEPRNHPVKRRHIKQEAVMPKARPVP